MIPAPGWARVLSGVLCGATALWAVVGSMLSIVLPAIPVWTMFGFEVVIVVAAVMGLLFAIGHFREAPALTIACVAGCVFVGSFLGYQGSAGVLGGLSLKLWLLGRVGVVVALGGVAVLIVLVRNRKSWAALRRGVALGAAPALVALVFGLASLGYGRTAPAPPPGVGTGGAGGQVVATASAKRPAWLDESVRRFMAIGLFRSSKGAVEAGRIVLLTVLGLAMIGLTSAGTHYVIRAFQLGAFPDAADGGGGRGAAGSTVA